MRNGFRWLLCTALCLSLVQTVWADDLEGDGFYSRQLLFDTLRSSLDLDRDPEFTPEEIEDFEKLFHDFAADSKLADDEVFALNRSLNNARHTPWRVDFTTEENWALLEHLIENDYDARQINSLTKALESEAKFLSHYERTGNEFFLTKAETEKSKFLSRIGELDEEGNLIAPLPHGANRAAVLQARHEARSALKDVARQARLQAKTLARETTRLTARGSSRNAAKQLAQETRRELKSTGRPSQSKRGKNK